MDNLLPDSMLQFDILVGIYIELQSEFLYPKTLPVRDYLLFVHYDSRFKVATFLATFATFANTVKVETTNMEMIAIQAATISAGVLKQSVASFKKGPIQMGLCCLV